MLDSRIGANVKELQKKTKSGQPSGSETPMDVDALTKGRTKGGKDPKFGRRTPQKAKVRRTICSLKIAGSWATGPPSVGSNEARRQRRRGKKAKARRTARKARPLGRLAQATLARPSDPRDSTASAKKRKKEQFDV